MWLYIYNYKQLENIVPFFKLSQFLKYPQLIDIVTYNNIFFNKSLLTTYIFKQLPINISTYLIVKNSQKLPSISDTFINSIWFERENKEFFNISFYGSLDTRNLLLTYLNNEFPLLKSYPTIGLKEIFYNLFIRSIANVTISTQV